MASKKAEEASKTAYYVQIAASAATVVALVVSVWNGCITNRNLKLSQETFKQEYTERIVLTGCVQLETNRTVQEWPEGGASGPATTFRMVTMLYATNGSRFPIAIDSVNYSCLSTKLGSIDYGGKWIQRGKSTQDLPKKLEPGETIEINDTLSVNLPIMFSKIDSANIESFWRGRPVHQVLDALSMTNKSIQNVSDADMLGVAVRSASGGRYSFNYKWRR